ncbi:class I SAM-dependent methyltransferase [Bacillus weihaiensis]|uniref:Methyltransferase domain-containing protein n=1 Tax=Bacillus weihaiensis TaxID=1547283 RepID=A0A1L3MW67_9BACI|nr:class I SAM-dependent methyltransferase [Bacillus weihaiensis]APH06586.1 hypothetical protein A9C19_18745 [Bacillus weihaiensis]
MIKQFKKQFRVPNGLLGVVAGKIMAWENKKLNAWSVSCLGIDKHDHLLEVGFGAGACMETVLKRNTTVTIDGLDISETMKNQAESALEPYVEKNRVHLMVGDVSKVQLTQDGYDKILSVNNFTIWTEPQKGVASLYQALKPGGKIAITMQPREEDASPNKTRMFAKKIHDDLVTCHFRDVKITYKKIRPELAVCVTAYKR